MEQWFIFIKAGLADVFQCLHSVIKGFRHTNCIFVFWSTFGHFSMSSFGRLRLLAYNYRIRISDCVFVFSIFCCCRILIKVVAKDVLQCLHSAVMVGGTQIFWWPLLLIHWYVYKPTFDHRHFWWNDVSTFYKGGVTNHSSKPCESPHCTFPLAQQGGYSNSLRDFWTIIFLERKTSIIVNWLY